MVYSKTKQITPASPPAPPLPTHLRNRIIPPVVAACSSWPRSHDALGASPVRMREKVGDDTLVEHLVMNTGDVVRRCLAVAPRVVGVEHNLPSLPADEGDRVRGCGARGWKKWTMQIVVW